jgi:hypothetical protein
MKPTYDYTARNSCEFILFGRSMRDRGRDKDKNTNKKIRRANFSDLIKAGFHQTNIDMMLYKIAENVNPSFKLENFTGGRGALNGKDALIESLMNTQLLGKSDAAFIVGCLSAVMLVIPAIVQTLGTGLELSAARALTAGRDWAEGRASNFVVAGCNLIITPVFIAYLLIRLANTLISMVANPRNMYNKIVSKTGMKKFAALVGLVGTAGAVMTGLYSGALLLPTAMNAMPVLCAGALNNAGVGFTLLRNTIMTFGCSSTLLPNIATTVTKSVKQAASFVSKAVSSGVKDGSKRVGFINKGKENVSSDNQTTKNKDKYKPPTFKQ